MGIFHQLTAMMLTKIRVADLEGEEEVSEERAWH
jgi:hypothetical protein